jgi:hypothetical protein
MSKFFWLPLCYTAYVISLNVQNTIALIHGQPLRATGYWTSWVVCLSVFLIAFLAEWIVVMVQRD